MPHINWGRAVAAIALWTVLAAAIALTFLPALIILATKAPAREAFPGQWAQVDPARQEFFRKAWRPDYGPTSSCCGEADAYEADEWELDPAGNLFAIITEGDAPTCWSDEEGNQTCKPRIATGTRIPIPLDKILPPPPTEPRNTTGRGIVWIAGNGRDVFCYALPSGL